MSPKVKPIDILGELRGGHDTGGLLENAITITPCSPFTGRAIAEPTVQLEHLPAVFDTSEPPEADATTVMQWVGDDPERARAAQLKELQRPTPRPKLLKALSRIE